MNYFNYHSTTPMGRIWSLFTDLNFTEQDNASVGGCAYAHTLNIVQAAMNGKISLEEGGFDLKAYEYRCHENDNVDRINSYKECLFIVDEQGVGDEEVTRTAYGDISARKLKSKTDDYEEIEDMEAFEANLNILLDIQQEYLSVKGIDLIKLLANSLKGIPEAKERLLVLVEKNKELKELVTNLLLSSEEGLLLKKLVSLG